MAENLEIEGRMSVRAPMQWSDERHGGFTTAKKPGRPLVDAPGWGPDQINVASQRREEGSLLNWMERLIRRRRECPELGWGACTVLDVSEPAVLAHRCDWDGNVVVAVHSFADAPLEVEVPLGDAEAAVDLFAHDDLEPDGKGRVRLALEPYGHRWLRLRHDGQRLPP